MTSGVYPRPKLRRECKKCSNMFTPVTKHSKTCNSCQEKAHIVMVLKKRAESKNVKIKS